MAAGLPGSPAQDPQVPPRPLPKHIPGHTLPCLVPVPWPFAPTPVLQSPPVQHRNDPTGPHLLTSPMCVTPQTSHLVSFLQPFSHSHHSLPESFISVPAPGTFACHTVENPPLPVLCTLPHLPLSPWQFVFWEGLVSSEQDSSTCVSELTSTQPRHTTPLSLLHHGLALNTLCHLGAPQIHSEASRGQSVTMRGLTHHCHPFTHGFMGPS